MKRAFLGLAFAACLGGCPQEPVPPPPKPLPPPVVDRGVPLAPPQADGHLPPLAVPTHYTLDLDIDPTKPRFGGVVSIDVDIPQKTANVVLHARDVEIKSARAVGKDGKANEAKASLRNAHRAPTAEELVLAFADPIPAGKATIRIEYTAPFDDELSGIYRLKQDERWYAFSQFEPTDARRAFPSFDEPGFKTPYDVTVTVPRPMIAVANAPETSHEDAGDKTRFRFAATPPLPSYLVAIAVGELDIREAQRFTKPPVRLITTKGRNTPAMGDLALEAASGLIDTLAEWFALPYPYQKLDIVAVPDFSAGAMENPGLVTFREELLLVDSAHASVDARRDEAFTISHELAHQWFGDLVTAAWWDDLWLNEGMATWMEWRSVDKWRPAYNARTDATVSALGVMSLDGLATARAIRQPVVTTAEADEAFDGITYQKGAAILSTIEKWIGESKFQEGVRAYIKDNQWKSVHADKLMSALDKASGKDVTGMAASYVDKPGVPEVNAHTECEAGGRWHVELSSQQWRPLGSKLPESTDRTWTIPVCIDPDKCTDLVAGAPALLAGKGACPGVIHPNPGGGYYRFALPENELLKLAQSKKKLDVGARASVLSNAWAAVRSGQLDASVMLKLLPLFDDDPARQVVEQVDNIVRSMSFNIVEDSARPAFQKFVAARFVKRKKALGWKGKPDPSGDDSLTRTTVLRALGEIAEDDATLKEAEEIAQKWLQSPTSVDADTGPMALELASHRAGAARLTALQTAMTKAANREDRGSAIHAMFAFDDEATQKRALDQLLDSETIHANEMRYVSGTIFQQRKGRVLAEAWVRDHWDAITKKYPGTLAKPFADAAGVGCSTKEAEAHAEFYTPRIKALESGERDLAQSLEWITLCSALREHAQPNLTKALIGKPVAKPTAPAAKRK